YLWELCTAVVLPFEFGSVADQFDERLNQLAGGNDPLGLGDAAALARAFAGSARKLDEAAQHWRARYEDGEKDEAAADILNACMKKLSRTLIPLASTSKGAY